MRTKPAAGIARLMLMLSVAVLAAAFLAVGMRSPILLWIAAGAAAMKGGRRVLELTSHGTARLATFTQELLMYGLLGDRGLIMGRAGVAERTPIVQGVRYLADPRFGSELACRMFLGSLFRSRRSGGADDSHPPIRACTYRGSGGQGQVGQRTRAELIVISGQLRRVRSEGGAVETHAAHRRDKLGHRVFFLNLIWDGHGARSDAFNPLDFIDASSPDFLSKCRDLANQLVIRTGEEREPHWNDAAEMVLSAFIAFVVACEPDKRLRTLTTVRRLISSPTAYKRAIETMQQVKGFWGVVAMQGKALQWFIDRELGSVMSTAQRHTAWMDDPQVSACLSSTTFDPRLLRTGKVTVYLGLPADQLVVLAGLMRTWLGSILRISTRGEATEKNPGTSAHR